MPIMRIAVPVKASEKLGTCDESHRRDKQRGADVLYQTEHTVHICVKEHDLLAADLKGRHVAGQNAVGQCHK